jgi:acetoin utilization deacetylase AcuC-like enzyme
MIFISAGFDAHEDDNLAHLNFTDKYAQRCIISNLESGYNIKALVNSVETHLLTLLGE